MTTILIGYPIDEEELTRLFEHDPIMSKYLCAEEIYTNFDKINKHLDKFGLMYTYTDKGQLVIGKQIDIPVWKDMKPVSQVQYEIDRSKREIHHGLEHAGVSISTINIYPMESDTIEMHDPEPFIVSWNG